MSKNKGGDSDVNTADSLKSQESSGIEGESSSGNVVVKKTNAPKKELKEIDAEAMLIKFNMNLTIFKYSTKELREDKKFSKNTLVLVTNYIYLLRVLAIHLLLIALPYAAFVQIWCLLAVELTYFLNLVIRYAKNQHLKSLRFLIPKAVQSVFILATQIVNLIIRWNNGDTDFPPSVRVQKAGMFFSMAGLIAEYICFFIAIVWMIVELIIKRKQKKKKADKYIVFKTLKPEPKPVKTVKKRMVREGPKKKRMGGNPIRLMMKSVRRFR